MKTFEQYTYERPSLASIQSRFTKLLEQFKVCKHAEEQLQALEKLNEYRNEIDSLASIVYIRASIDSTDEFYQQERDYFDEIGPEINAYQTEFYRALLESPFRNELEDKFGKQLFQIATYALKSFSKEVIPLLQKENKLTSEYGKLVASAQVEFKGETYTLAQLGPFLEHEDREIRKQALEVSSGFFATHSETFDDIFDQLVHIRHEIAVTLGFNNFVELGYVRMLRVDYDAKMVENFRKQVREQIVPIVSNLYEKQAKRIGVETLAFYDENYKFQTGNAKPKGTPEWIIENGKQMYHELSEETKEFFDFMLERNLMDLVAKKGKEAGGYCSYIADYGAPFIFSNFNGTSGDIDVLTHEAGHAFQFYSSRHLDVPEYIMPTYEAAEIHSMSMEFFTWPWMELFFEDEVEKYQFSHLTDGLDFIPYGVAVDHFQHLIYENPEWSPEERKAAWKQMEELYLPHRNYDGNAYLEAGNLWKRQGHIYNSPFYYIDYTLAQICAFQFWKKSRENYEAAWDDYLHLCSLGGSKSFLQLVAEAKLISPFADGSVESVITSIQSYIEEVDDQAL